MGAEHIHIIGAGSMGGAMSLLFTEQGATVSVFDKSQDSLNTVIKNAKETSSVDEKRITTFSDFKEFMASGRGDQKQRIIVFSLPHGGVVDSILDEIEPLSSKGDIILDCDNEWWEDSERRQARCSKDSFGNGAIHFMSCGVSGGYQSARRGPSMCPSGDKGVYNIVEPLLKKWAAKDAKGNPCVAYMGKGGSGHQIKMLHNGIEQGILSAVCEVYGLLRHSLDHSNDEIGDLFERWDNTGSMRGNFLVQIGSEIARFKKGDGVEDRKGIVDDIEDKVTQDADDSEGTGFWTMREFGLRHVAAPTLASAHSLRVASANRGERDQITKLLNLPQESGKPESVDRKAMTDSLRVALYGATLASFVQGCNVIARAARSQNWDVNMANCIKIWRAGCIIQSDYISDFLQPIYEEDPHLDNILLNAKVCSELASTYKDLKRIVCFANEVDACIPALSATLEYLKMIGGRNLPTNFEEAELDYFGHHNYDLRTEHVAAPIKGTHHTEWKPA